MIVPVMDKCRFGNLFVDICALYKDKREFEKKMYTKKCSNYTSIFGKQKLFMNCGNRTKLI